MNLIRKIFSVTPFKISFLLVTLSVFTSIVIDIYPKAYTLLSMVAEKSLDMKFNFRGFQKQKNKIVVVSGDEEAFKKFGQWPFDRGSVFAPMLKEICHLNPKAMGLDIVWSEQERLMPQRVIASVEELLGEKAPLLKEKLKTFSGDESLKEAMAACGPKLVLGYMLSSVANEGDAGEGFQQRLKFMLEAGNNYLVNMSTEGTLKFPEYLNDPLATVSFRSVAKSGLMNHPNITPAGVGQGFFNNTQDTDGSYRSALLFYRASDYFVPSLTLRLAQKAMTAEDSKFGVKMQPNVEGKISESLDLKVKRDGKIVSLPVDLYGTSLVNYRGPNYTFPNVSMSEVMNGSPEIQYLQFNPDSFKVETKKAKREEFFNDALVLMGITAIGLYDIRPRPLDPQASGVENHANILDNIVSGDFLTRPTAETLLKVLIAVFALSLIYGTIIARLSALRGAAFALITIASLIYIDQIVLFNRYGIVVLSIYVQVGQLLLQYIGITVLKFMKEEDEKKFIRSAFDKYVSPAVINSMLSDPSKLKIGGEKKELTVLFSDIRGFTELSEKLDVKTLTQFLNEYLGSMTDILQNNKGTLDKYIGDAVMGFWGAPLDLKEHAELAVKTAIEMVEKLDELNEKFKQQYNGLTIDIGIGINSGSVSVGNFGSSKVFEYTVIGDSVNLASRLEGVNKFYGTHIIISESTHQMLPPNKYLCREVDTVRVKGKKKPVKIYEVFPDNQKHKSLKEVLQPFTEALQKYYSQEWAAAKAAFEQVLGKISDDKTTLELIHRCEYYSQNPPETNWDGSFEMKTK